MALRRSERPVDIDETWPRHDPLRRDAQVSPAQVAEDRVVGLVDGREIDMATFTLADLVAVVAAQHIGNAQPSPRTNDADDALSRERPRRPAQIGEMLVADLRYGMADRPEIIDERKGVEPDLVLDRASPDDPWVVGELEDLPAHRAGNRDPGQARQRTPELHRIGLPRGLQAGVVRGLERDRLLEGQYPPVRDLGDRKTRVGSSNIDGNDLHVR